MKKSHLLIGLILLGSCSSEQEVEQPKDLMTEEDFVPLLVDLKVLEEHYHRIYIRPDVYSASLDSASTFIFDDHETSKEEFRQSLLYYCQDIDVIYTVFETALDTINRRVSGGEHTVQPNQGQ